MDIWVVFLSMSHSLMSIKVPGSPTGGWTESPEPHTTALSTGNKPSSRETLSHQNWIVPSLARDTHWPQHTWHPKLVMRKSNWYSLVFGVGYPPVGSNSFFPKDCGKTRFKAASTAHWSGDLSVLWGNKSFHAAFSPLLRETKSNSLSDSEHG